MYNAKVRGVLIEGGKTYQDISRDVLRPLDTGKTPLWWWIASFFASAMLVWGVWGFYNTIVNGIGTWPE